MSKIKLYTSILLFAVPVFLFSQEKNPSKSLLEQYQIEIVLALAVVVCLVLLLAMFIMYKALKMVIRAKQIEEGIIIEEKELIPAKEGEESVDFWGRFWNRFHESVPVAKEETVATGHEYDGIRELDNQLPSWWLYGFYASILFGVIYLVNYHVIGTGLSQAEEYEVAMQKADKEVSIYLASLDNLVDENSVSVSAEIADLNAGRAIYESNCAVCHAKDGGGGVGPNFTDKNWIHGGDIKSIFKTIKYGVPSKGMISWEAQLSPKKISQVANYIYTLEGQPTADPKEPQGELFEREDKEEGEDDNSNAIDDEADLEDGECC
jgi:cytochrome c oxidase cbb3-type subunit III